MQHERKSTKRLESSLQGWVEAVFLIKVEDFEGWPVARENEEL